MANLPVYLAPNLCSLYGLGHTTSINNIVAPPGYLFNSIYQIGDINTRLATVGDEVLYRQGDEECRLVWDNATWVLLPIDKIIVTEQPIPPLP